jgi:tetratricopeptide (TPR) repeat protein
MAGRRAQPPAAHGAVAASGHPLIRARDVLVKARMKSGYEAAREGDYAAARAEFQAAGQVAGPEGQQGAAFGSLSGQAAYQAAVCLMAEGKKAEAEAEFYAFLEERPESPLCRAAYRRIVALNEGVPPKRAEDLLQQAISSREKRLRFEMSVCGPKVIARLLDHYRLDPAPYEEIARACGTTEEGTTMEGMSRGLRAYGFATKGFSLNRHDFGKVRTPAIWLASDHYVLVLEIARGKALVYDPSRSVEAWVPLPPPNDPSFFAIVLTVTKS